MCVGVSASATGLSPVVILCCIVSLCLSRMRSWFVPESVMYMRPAVPPRVASMSVGLWVICSCFLMVYPCVSIIVSMPSPRVIA